MIDDKLTKKDIASNIYSNVGISYSESYDIVKDIVDVLINGIVEYKKFNITNFGTFKVNHKKERIGRNPRNKEEHTIIARNVISFSISRSFKNKLK